MSAFTFPLLRGKTAIVTGGTTGIGRAIVLEYLRQGCNVTANYLGQTGDEVHKASLEQEAAAIRAAENTGIAAGDLMMLAGDISKPHNCEQMVDLTVQRFGRLDIMVANAGVFKPAEFLEYVSCTCYQLLH